MGNHQSGNKSNFRLNIKKSKSQTHVTPGIDATPNEIRKQTPQYNKTKSIPNKHQISNHYNQNYNHIAVSAYQIDHTNKNNNTPSIWFNIGIKHKNNTNDYEKKLVEGIYRKVQFIDTIFHTQTKEGNNMDIMENMNQYSNHYTSDRNVYVKIYNFEQKQLDQKHDNIFLWHDGIKWIFSNYNTLYYYLDNIRSKKKWVIKPERNIDNILISLSNEYPNDLNKLKERNKIQFKNMFNDNFELIINNYSGKHYSKHQQQFEEDPSLRNTYSMWRDNLNIIYQRNQLFTMNQLVNEEKEYYHKKEAKDIMKIIEEINDICLSMEFRKLLKRYKDKSIKIIGWKNKGEIEIHINDNTYTQFYKCNIDHKTNKQLSNMNVRDIVLQFHKYYCELFSELNELDQFQNGVVTYK